MATCPACRTRYADDVDTCEVDGEKLLPNAAFSNADTDLEPGTTVGEYQIEAKIGEGGFGAVYRAVHPLIGKAAAIKVLNRQYSSNPQMVSRFIAEARAVNQIRHRNIIDIFAFGSLEDGRQYFVMELLEGKTFDGYLKEHGALDVAEALPILRSVGRALDAAHATGIAHRDLKPENIFLVFDEDGGVFPKLLDFGIAKLLADGAMAHKTRTGTPMGTPHYMSPEQCRGKNVDHRTDIYSFGIMIHEVLTGQLPFDGDDVMDVLLKQTTAAAPSMSSVRPGLPKGLDAPVLHMLDKDPAQRPASIGAAIDALAVAAQSAGYAVASPSKRSERGTTSTGGARVVTGGGVGKEDPSLTDARTMAVTDPSTKTFLGTESDVKQPSARRPAVIAGVAALALGVVFGGAWMLMARGDAKPAARVGASSVTASADATPLPPSHEPSVTPAPASAAAVLSTEIELTVEVTPDKGVDVYLGSQKLGTAPGPLKLKRGDAKVKLTLKSPGYSPKDVEVLPSANCVVSATLDKAVAKKRSDLEF